MIEKTATTLARELHDILSLVERGETVRILKHGRAVARLVPDCEFLSGKRVADLFRNYKPTAQDIAAADAIEVEIRKLDMEQDDALAH